MNACNPHFGVRTKLPLRLPNIQVPWYRDGAPVPLRDPDGPPPPMHTIVAATSVGVDRPEIVTTRIDGPLDTPEKTLPENVPSGKNVTAVPIGPGVGGI